MNHHEILILSSGEIYVLAGLLGYSSVFGVKDHTLREWQGNIGQHVRKTMEKLEKRMLILFELDGSICWQKSVDDMMRCIGNPDMAALIMYNSGAGRVKEKWLLQKDGKTVVLRQIAEDAYQLQVMEDALRKTVSPLFENHRESRIHETIPFAAVQKMRDEMDAFNRDAAEAAAAEQIRSHMQISTLLAAIDGTARFLSVQTYQRKDVYYSSGFNCLLVNAENQVLQLHCDEQNLLHFDSISEEDILRHLSSEQETP